jgi:hypothetical protein
MTVRPSFNAGRRRDIQLKKGVILDGAFFLLLLTISFAKLRQAPPSYILHWR